MPTYVFECQDCFETTEKVYDRAEWNNVISKMLLVHHCDDAHEGAVRVYVNVDSEEAAMPARQDRKGYFRVAYCPVCKQLTGISTTDNMYLKACADGFYDGERCSCGARDSLQPMREELHAEV